MTCELLSNHSVKDIMLKYIYILYLDLSGIKKNIGRDINRILFKI